MATAAELLDEVESAISDLLSGGVRSHSVSGRSYETLSLAELMRMRADLRAEVNAGRSTMNYAEFGDSQ